MARQTSWRWGPWAMAPLGLLFSVAVAEAQVAAPPGIYLYGNGPVMTFVPSPVYALPPVYAPSGPFTWGDRRVARANRYRSFMGGRETGAVGGRGRVGGRDVYDDGAYYERRPAAPYLLPSRDYGPGYGGIGGGYGGYGGGYGGYGWNAYRPQ